VGERPERRVQEILVQDKLERELVRAVPVASHRLSEAKVDEVLDGVTGIRGQP
jgi:hypothetical protein